MELVSFIFAMMSLMKFLTTVKMMVMIMSLELCSAFLFFLLVIYSSLGGSLCMSFYCVFLVFVVCEGVMALVMILGIFRKGSLMVKSLFSLKF